VQRCAEILLSEAKQHFAGETSLEEIRFVLFGEPTYRIFESALDAVKIREQMERLPRYGWARSNPKKKRVQSWSCKFTN